MLELRKLKSAVRVRGLVAAEPHFAQRFVPLKVADLVAHATEPC